MDLIELRNMTLYGYHGVLPEEQRLGQRFVVDVRLGLNLAAAGQRDDLTLTANYAEVAETVRGIVEGPPFQLIEALAEALAVAIFDQFPLVEHLTVRVGKPSAPVSTVPSAQVAVEISRAREQIEQEPTSDADASIERGGALSASTIRALLAQDPPLIAPVADLDAQVQPNGMDLTLESVWRLHGIGALGLDNADRTLPDRRPIEPEADGWYTLGPGTYIIRLAETVALPLDMMAFGRPRSSLLRCGAALHTAVWDAGYRGRSESLLIVYAEAGVRLERGTRVMQLVFVRLDSFTHAYAGAYQRENIPS